MGNQRRNTHKAKPKQEIPVVSPFRTCSLFAFTSRGRTNESPWPHRARTHLRVITVYMHAQVIRRWGPHHSTIKQPIKLFFGRERASSNADRTRITIFPSVNNRCIQQCICRSTFHFIANKNTSKSCVKDSKLINFKS
jgi:hypothetical protein